jgi:hypothetical protein
MPWIWTGMKLSQFSPYARFHCRTITKSERTGDNGWYMVIWIHMSRLDMIWTCAPAWTLWNLWSPTSAWDSRILTETVGLPPESLMCLFSLTSSSDNSDLKQVNWLNWLTTCWLLEVTKGSVSYLSSPCFSTSIGGIGGPARVKRGILAVMYWISIIRVGSPPLKWSWVQFPRVKRSRAPTLEAHFPWGRCPCSPA